MVEDSALEETIDDLITLAGCYGLHGERLGNALANFVTVENVRGPISQCVIFFESYFRFFKAT